MSRPRGITEERIANLHPARNGKRYDFPDGCTPNLFVRVGARQKVFVLLGRFGGGKNPARRSIGAFPRISLAEARTIAAAWNALIERGLDPRKEQERTEEEKVLAERRTFASAMEDYVAYLPSRDENRHVVEDAKAIRRDILDRARNPWLGKPMGDVADVDVSTLVEAIRGRGSPAAAFTAFVHLKTFFSWAMEPNRRIAYGLSANPLRDLKPKVLGLRRRVRKHLIADHELQAYWKAAGRTPYPYGPIFKGALLTGVRKTEFARMRWSEIDWESMLWTIPEERSKSGTVHLVPLSAAMLVLLDEVRRGQPPGHGDCVFSTTNGQIPVNGFSKATAAFRAEAEAALSEMRPQAVMRRWVLHDTRRVVRSALSALGVRREVAETVIGHGKRGIEAVYNQYEYLAETRDALSRLADHLARVVAGAGGQSGPR
jgi:integrase